MIALNHCYQLLGIELLFLFLLVFIYFKIGKKKLLFIIFSVFLLIVSTLYFFRDPVRHPTISPDTVLSPADGRIVKIENGVKLFQEDQTYICISIYLSLFDVHINRSPVTGRVFYREHTSGYHKPAFSEGASSNNENLMLGINTELGRFYIKQISGMLARRIVCDVNRGDYLKQGVKYGMIKFGSRVELYIPEKFLLNCSIGDRVRAGESLMCYYES